MQTVLHKRADLGGDPDRSFEQSLGRLAYIYVQEKAPRLLPHILGFQLVDRNEDGTRALGILGVQMGRDQLAYMPIFFLNGELKGHEILILRDKRLFVPMKEAWINFLLADAPALEGVLVSGDQARRQALPPNLREILLPPKLASVAASMPPWAVQAMPVLAKAAQELPPREPCVLHEVVRTSLPALEVLAAWQAGSPRLARALDRHYGPDFLKRACAAWRSRVLLSPVEWPKQAAARIQVLFYSASLPPSELSEEEKERLLQDGLVVRDERDDGEISLVCEAEPAQSWVTPSRTGLYDMLCGDGSLAPVWVVVAPVGGCGGRFLLVWPDGSGWSGAYPADVLVLDRSRDADPVEFAQLRSLDSLSPGQTYVAVYEDQVSIPFTVLRPLDGGSRWEIHGYDLELATRGPGPLVPKRLPPPMFPADAGGHCDELEIVDGGRRMEYQHRVLYVPSEARVLPLPDQCEGNKPPVPGGLAAATRAMVEKTAALELHYQPPEYVINDSQPVGYGRALETLLVRYGLREKQAREILQQTRERGHRSLRVKLAQGPYLSGYGPLAPAPSDPSWSSDPTLGLPILGQQEQFLPIAGMQGLPAAPMPFPPPSGDGMPLAPGMGPGLAAAEAGQTEVFDAQLVANLLQTVHQEHLVDRYLPTLLRALDRLGRLLFNFYWHAEDFEDRYGKQDLPELEDLLRNNFEALGDLVLFLFRKSVQPSELLLSGPNIEDHPGP